MSKLFERMKQLNPDDVQFHADRYESLYLFQEAIYFAQEGDEECMELTLQQALEATEEDRGDPGTIPCLGGEPQKVWEMFLSGENGGW